MNEAFPFVITRTAEEREAVVVSGCAVHSKSGSTVNNARCIVPTQTRDCSPLQPIFICSPCSLLHFLRLHLLFLLILTNQMFVLVLFTVFNHIPFVSLIYPSSYPFLLSLLSLISIPIYPFPLRVFHTCVHLIPLHILSYILLSSCIHPPLLPPPTPPSFSPP